ncbi:hypothetical protein HRbin09_00473 [bacterium HR09]|nr:hypothetical protein HRbin09_00473 [bacterium HR09]
MESNPLAEEAPVGEFSGKALGRVFRCFTEPRTVFAEIAARPTFFWVLLLTVVLSLGVQLVLAPRIDMEATVLQWAGQAGQELPEEQVQERVNASRRFRTFALVITPMGALAVTLLLGGVYFLALKVAGSEADYPPVLSAVANAGFPPSLAQSVLLSVVASTREPFPAQEIPRLLKSNVAAFLPEDAPRVLSALGGILDVFNVWRWLLLAWGLAAVGGVSLRKSAGVVAVLWGAWALLQVVLALLR